MFTGIITEIGEVKDITHTRDAARLTIGATTVLSDASFGASIAVNGVCLTVAEYTSEQFTADVMAETLRLTTLGDLNIGGRVNLERALAADGRFDGHIVQGHVDGTAMVTAVNPGEKWTDFTFETGSSIGRYLASKGSVAINGTSLTLTDVNDLDDEVGAKKTRFGVSLIPTTLSETTFSDLRIGSTVNIEVDVLAKYVERLVR